jgi:hypothetical protein
MKVLAGDWRAETPVAIKKGIFGDAKGIVFHKRLFSVETMPIRSIQSAELVDANNYVSIAGKLGWTVAGAVVLGPLGALVGAIGG